MPGPPSSHRKGFFLGARATSPAGHEQRHCVVISGVSQPRILGQTICDMNCLVLYPHRAARFHAPYPLNILMDSCPHKHSVIQFSSTRPALLPQYFAILASFRPFVNLCFITSHLSWRAAGVEAEDRHGDREVAKVSPPDHMMRPSRMAFGEGDRRFSKDQDPIPERKYTAALFHQVRATLSLSSFWRTYRSSGFVPP